ncbi:MAG TPA: hypothetical protein DCY85_05915 [Firmicutes bacterium]|nr:hypothetical protein [Bacillota bacterium]HBL68719.1 hypothetical protein [Bacillota bacterium]HCF91270.1 hypothetical protein [Bacillota bacterium]
MKTVLDHLALKTIPLFSGLEEEELKKIAMLFSVRIYQRDAAIVSYGDPANEFFLIKHGVVRVYRLNESGEQVVLAILGGGDFFGEMGLFTDSLRTAWVNAMTAINLYVMQKADFRALLMSFPELCWKMLGMLSQRLIKSDEQLENLACLNVEERLQKALGMLAQEFGYSEGVCRVIPLKISHRLLGEMTGTSRESVTRALGRLEKKGWLTRGNDKMILRGPSS